MTETTPGTAIICVQPELDITFVGLVGQVNAVLKNAEVRVIASNNDLAPATDELVFIATLLKAVKAKQTEYAAPIELHLKAVKDAFGCLLTPLGHADRITRDKIKEYRQKVDDEVRAAEAVEAARLQLARAQEALTGEHTVDLTPLEKPVVPTKVDSYTGMTGVARIRKWQLIDKSLVPMDFLMLDTTAIGKAVRGGIGNIPGIRIYIEESLRVTPY